MFVSVILTTHSLDNWQNLADAISSLLNQTYVETEIIIVVDGNPELSQRIAKVYDGQHEIKIVATTENVGCPGARNTGIRAARGDVIAFLDDDAVAETTWIETLVGTYEELGAIAVGGKILPIWLCDRPGYLPEEFYWLVGVTHEGFADEKVVEVRNTFGPNTSFKREVFEKVGLFKENLGLARTGRPYLQADEAEFSLRMKEQLGKGVIYNPEAIVYHKIPKTKVEVKMLLKTAFCQGYSKALLRSLSSSPEPLATEKSYLSDLLFKYIPKRIRRTFSASNCLSETKRLCFSAALILSVAIGFAFGYGKRVRNIESKIVQSTSGNT